MILSRDYFTICEPGQGQRVGADWYQFSDKDSLSRMINDGLLGKDQGDDDSDCSECASKDSEISSLEDSLSLAEDDLSEANKTIARLEREMSQLQKGKSA